MNKLNSTSRNACPIKPNIGRLKFSSLLFLLLISSLGMLKGQSLTEVSTILSSWYGDDIEYVDIDNDGDLDIYLNGDDSLFNLTSTIFINDNQAGGFTELSSPIVPLNNESHAFADVNNDGWLDLFHTGRNDNGDRKSYLYMNSGGSFTIIDSTIASVRYGAIDFGDIDNDGDLDLITSGTGYNSGTSSNEAVTTLYLNQGGTFTLASQYFVPRVFPSAKMLDYDLDGDLDYFSSGEDSLNIAISASIYNNQNGVFSIDAGTMLPTLQSPESNWADFDNDGDMDLAISGSFQTSQSATIYANNGGIFAPTTDSLLPLVNGNVQWGDLNNDGFPELTLCGNIAGTGDSTQIYVQNSSNNSFQGFPFPPTFSANTDQIKLGDFDNNGTLDALRVGGPNTKLFSNAPATSNTAPTAPTINSLYTINPDSSITITWTGASDTETPTPGLSYSLWIGTSEHGIDITSPPADTNTGYRRVVEYGQVKTTSWTLKGLDCGNEYWFRVQAVDGGYMGSEFSAPLHVVLQPTASITQVGGCTVATTVVGTQAVDSVQWYDNGVAIIGANSLVYELVIPPDTFINIYVTVWRGFCSFTTPSVQAFCIGFEDAIQVSNVNVWPNPANDAIHIQVENPGATEVIEIFDMQGRLMRSMNKDFRHETEIALNGLSPGLYLVKMSLKNGRGIATATFVKE